MVKLEVGTQDVTEEYVDVEARLTNLEALETELRALLAEVRQDAAGKPAALLQVYDEIGCTREEIELIAGRQRLLDDLVALATITVTVKPSPIVAPVVDEGWQPEATVREAVATRPKPSRRSRTESSGSVSTCSPCSPSSSSRPGSSGWWCATGDAVRRPLRSGLSAPSLSGMDPGLVARLDEIGVDPGDVGDPAYVWRRLFEHFGRRTTLVDRYELEAHQQGSVSSTSTGRPGRGWQRRCSTSSSPESRSGTDFEDSHRGRPLRRGMAQDLRVMASPPCRGAGT